MCYKIYKRRRVDRHYDGISNPVIPETYTIIESLVANIAGGNPRCNYVPTTEEQNREVHVLNGMFDYVMECNNMGIKQQQWVREMEIYGTGILVQSWEDGKIRIDNVPLRDFFVDPAATNKDNASYMGHRYLADKDELKKMVIYDAEKNKYVKRYKNLGKIKPQESGQEGEEGTDKQWKEMYTGSTYGNMADKKQVEIIKIHDIKNGRLIEIANRKQIIFNEPTPYQKLEETIKVDVEIPNKDPALPPTIKKVDRKVPAIKPFAPYAVLRNVVDTSLFYGEGDIEVISDLQERLNDWESMDMDIAAIIAMPMFFVDPQFADLAPEIQAAPGAVYPIPRNAMGQMDQPNLKVDISQKKYEIQEQMRRATAADEVVQGVSQQQGRVTATEVQSQLNQATQRFSTKITNLESEGYAQLASNCFKMFQIFVSQEQAVRIVGKEGVEFKDYDPYEFSGEYEPHVKLETTIRQQKLEEGQKLNQLYQIMMTSGVYDQRAIGRWIVEKIDPDMSKDELEGLLAPPTPPTPPEDPTKEILTLAYKDASPWVKAQIEQAMGLQPDPMHEIEMDTIAKEHAAKQVMLGDPSTDITGKPIPPSPMGQGDMGGMQGGMGPSPEELPEGQVMDEPVEPPITAPGEAPIAPPMDSEMQQA